MLLVSSWLIICLRCLWLKKRELIKKFHVSINEVNKKKDQLTDSVLGLPISLVTGGEIVSTFGRPELVKFGHCDLIEKAFFFLCIFLF